MHYGKELSLNPHMEEQIKEILALNPASWCALLFALVF
jgi:hypothetical protein